MMVLASCVCDFLYFYKISPDGDISRIVIYMLLICKWYVRLILRCVREFCVLGVCVIYPFASNSVFSGSGAGPFLAF